MFLRSLLAATALLLGLSAHAEDASISSYYKITLLTENFPPYNMSVGGKHFALEKNITGISADIVREMFKRASINYSMALYYPWERIYESAKEKADYGIFSAARTPERENEFKWVGPIGPDNWVLLTTANSPIKLKTLEDAKKYRIGAYKDDAVAETLIKQGITPTLELRDEENAKKLQAGTIDIWATTDPVGRYVASQIGIDNLNIALSFYNGGLYLALNKKTPDAVVSKLQSALDQMRKEGKVDDITNLYL